MEKYKNIPDPGFSSKEPVIVKKRAIVSFRESDKITLSGFAIWQLIAGAEYAHLLSNAELNLYTALKVISVLGRLGIEMASGGVPANEIMIDCDEVEVLRKLLELRMTHCEKERDAGLESFSIDTYIGQKLLLIELGEWLVSVDYQIIPDTLPITEEDIRRNNQNG